MTKLELAKLRTDVHKLIFKYFKDKKDAGGHDYLQHLYAVAEGVEKEGNYVGADIDASLRLFYDTAFIVALLHDILEDTDCTVQELKSIGCDDNIIEAIKSVTRRKDEQYYFGFIERVSKNPIGRLVKIHDLENNMDVRRLSKFGDYEQKRLKKYWYSWKYLKREISAEDAIAAIHPKGYK